MAAANTDLFLEVGSPGTATTLSSPGYTSGVSTSINVASTTNWPTTTGVVFAMDEVTTVNGEEVRVDGTYNEFVGTVASGTQITNVDYVGGDAERSYSAGTTTRVYIPVSAERENRLVEGLLVSHDQDGTLKAGSVDAAAVLANGVVTAAKLAEGSTTAQKATATSWSGAITVASLTTSPQVGATLTINSSDLPGTGNYKLLLMATFEVAFGGGTAFEAYGEIYDNTAGSAIHINYIVPADGTYFGSVTLHKIVTVPAATARTIQFRSARTTGSGGSVVDVRSNYSAVLLGKA